MSEQKIILYTSNYCGHSVVFERFFERHEIPVEVRNIDGDEAHRASVKALNSGYASVPTLLFPDGTQLTEPTLRQLEQKLEMEPNTLLGKIKGLLKAE